MTKVVDGERTNIGVGLYMSGEDAVGAAFRCERQRLYALIAVKPGNIRAMMFANVRRPKSWDVSYSVGDQDAREEEWVSIHSGDMLMVKSKATAYQIYAAAKRGLPLTVKPRYGKEVTVEMPADATGLFDKFWAYCGLESNPAQ